MIPLLMVAVLICFSLPCPQVFCTDFDPAIELSAFELDPAVEVNCFASEPMIANPIAMNFDPRGRLWVICSYAYPQIKPGQEARDALIILEDTNQDGRADKSKVFYDQLLVPTGFALGDGGVYIASPPDLLFLKDTDGDDLADEVKVLFSGFGTEDNHHAIHAWCWSPGGLLYFQSGTFLHTQVETPYGVVRLNDGGVFQLHPRSRKLDLYVHHGWANPWGHVFDKWGQNFLTEAPGGGIFYLLPGQVKGHLEGAYPGLPGAPKSCGAEFVSGAHMPDDWQGDLILNAFKNRVVCRYRLSEDGSGFAAKEMPPVLVSHEENFRPVDAKIGPDGALYIADWYNPIIGHMQYNFRDPRRDTTHGRIWRVTAKGRPLLKPPVLENQPPLKLLDQLKSPVDFNRNQARRVLYDSSPTEVAPALAEWVQSLDPKDPGFEHHRLEALWASQTVDQVDLGLLQEVLGSPDPRARAAATRVLRDWRDQLPNALDLLAVQVRDTHPRVRLEAVVALSYIPSLRSMELALEALDFPTDRYLEYALRNTARALEDLWLPRIESGEVLFGGHAGRIAFALQAVHSEGAVSPLLIMLKEGRIPRGRWQSVIEIASTAGGPDQLAQVFSWWLDHQPDSNCAAPLLRAAQDRRVIPSGDLSGLEVLLNSPDEEIRTGAIQLAGVWRVESLRPELEKRVAGMEGKRTRLAAVEALAELGGKTAVDFLKHLAAGSQEAETHRLAALGLAPLDLPSAATEAARCCSLLTQDKSLDSVDLNAVWSAFLGRKGGITALTMALSREPLSADVAKLGLRFLNASGTPAPELQALFTQAAQLNKVEADLDSEQMQALIAEIQTQGDPARGEKVYRRSELACSQCHAIQGAGGQVGPDLSGIGVSSQLDYLVEAILTPAKAVREGYTALLVETDEGEIHQGVLLRENDQELVLRDVAHDEIVIPLDSIVERRETGTVMPDGLASFMTHPEFVDLVRFLYEIGRPGPYATVNQPVIRRWRDLDPIPGNLVNGIPDSLALSQALSPWTWNPIYSEVSGLLPLEELAGRWRVVVVQCQVEATTGGEFELFLNSPLALSAWMDGKRFDLGEKTVVDLQQGIHELTFRADLNRRGALGLRVEIHEAPGSPGRAIIAGGR